MVIVVINWRLTFVGKFINNSVHMFIIEDWASYMSNHDHSNVPVDE